MVGVVAGAHGAIYQRGHVPPLHVVVRRAGGYARAPVGLRRAGAARGHAGRSLHARRPPHRDVRKRRAGVGRLYLPHAGGQLLGEPDDGGGAVAIRNYLKTPLCHSELVSESPKEGNNPDEILKQVQDDTFFCVLR